MRLVNPRCPGYVCESSVTIVVIKDRRRAFVCAGRATRFYAADRTIARRVRTESDIAADVKIQAAIAVIIKERSAGMKLRAKFEARHSRLVRGVRECAIPVVVVQNVAAILRDIEIRESIVIVISPHAAEPITRTRNSSGLRDVLKRAVAIILVKSVPRSDTAIIKITAIHEINVRVSVTIEVRYACARTKYFAVDRNSLVAPEMDELNSGSCRDVRELCESGLNRLPVKITS